MRECRLIVDPAAPGAWNMAVDEALLSDAAENGQGTLRFYAWSEPTLSLGYFQQVSDREQHLASRECALVRRQTGGGAILHDREITYSLVLPASHPLTRTAPALYSAVHDAIIALLSPLAHAGHRHRLVRIEKSPRTTAHNEPFLCFERRAAGDVLVINHQEYVDPADRSPVTCEPPTGTKILGSAQRRFRGALLQHGSLLLERSPFAPELAGWQDLTGADIATGELAAEITAGLEKVLSLRLMHGPLPPELQSKACELANNKYGDYAWTNRR